MKYITYLIGAGFSAPLGLPLMQNFLVKSKDLYFNNPEQYKHFTEVFSTIEKMSVTKNYFDTDMFNIEEILSIMTMENYVFGKKLKKKFIQYIIDVIQAHTPPITIGKANCANWYDFVFGKNEMQILYGYFISNILGVKYFTGVNPIDRNNRLYIVDYLYQRDVRYSIVTLNYDLVFENFLAAVLKTYSATNNIEFIKNEYSPDWNNPHLSKLHGCVQSGSIIPPTWAKGINKNISKIWENAFNIINKSNEIRIIGYSLPLSDAYIKYLLKAAVMSAPHLKNIDVIVLDKTGEIKKRYDEFISFNYYRFSNSDVVSYLNLLKEYQEKNTSKDRNVILEMNRLELSHHDFMENVIKK